MLGHCFPLDFNCPLPVWLKCSREDPLHTPSTLQTMLTAAWFSRSCPELLPGPLSSSTVNPLQKTETLNLHSFTSFCGFWGLPVWKFWHLWDLHILFCYSKWVPWTSSHNIGLTWELLGSVLARPQTPNLLQFDKILRGWLCMHIQIWKGLL